jgi:hypothetical protein
VPPEKKKTDMRAQDSTTTKVAQDKRLEQALHQTPLGNLLHIKDVSKTMPECLVPGMCAEDDNVTLQRSSRLLKRHQLEAITLPPPRKFSQSPTSLKRTSSSVHKCARAETVPRGEIHKELIYPPFRRTSSWSCTSLRASIIECDVHLHRPASLAVQWESLMTNIGSESEETADDESSSSVALHPAMPSPTPATRAPARRSDSSAGPK